MEKDIEKLHLDILADIILKVKGAFSHRIGGVAVLGSSTIIISKFWGLASAGIYSNYTLIISALSNIAAQLITSATAGVGQLLTEKIVIKSILYLNN